MTNRLHTPLIQVHDDVMILFTWEINPSLIRWCSYTGYAQYKSVEAAIALPLPSPN